MSRRHERVKDLLSAYIDGQLTAAERETVQQHLAACDECVEEVRQIRAVGALLRSCPQVVPPRSFALKPAMVEGRGLVARLSLHAPLATVLAATLLVALVFADVRVLTPRPAMPGAAVQSVGREAAPVEMPAVAAVPETEGEPPATVVLGMGANTPAAAESLAAAPPDGTENTALAAQDATEVEAEATQEKAVADPMAAPEETRARAGGDRTHAVAATAAGNPTPVVSVLTEAATDESQVEGMAAPSGEATPAWRWALRGVQGALLVLLLASATLWLSRLRQRDI